jgi:hypothetical protein
MDATRVAGRETSETCSKIDSRLTREQVVDRIVNLNPTASTDFLSRFGEGPLSEYLARLDRAKGPRGREARWVRTGSSPAIVVRVARG